MASTANSDLPAYWCVLREDKLLLKEGKLPLLPRAALGFDGSSAQEIGEYEQRPFMWLEAPAECKGEFSSLRDLLGVLDSAMFGLAGRATQLHHMLHKQKFCPICGDECTASETEFAMVCQTCKISHYPRINPCVIVAVRKEDKILLALHRRNRGGAFSVIAGFVEAGESLEQCVGREVEEETGIKVTNIRYVCSQQWPFPSSLMMGFLADYQEGELTVDHDELLDAVWAGVDDLPVLTQKGTIARTLIDHTIAMISNPLLLRCQSGM